MALGDLTRQLAEQALSETLKGGKPAAPAHPDNPCATMLGQVQAMQKALKEDEELLVLLHSGAQAIRVLEIFVPTWQVVVITGIDNDRSITRVVSHSNLLQLVCKVVKAQPGAKPLRINVIIPKSVA